MQPGLFPAREASGKISGKVVSMGAYAGLQDRAPWGASRALPRPKTVVGKALSPTGVEPPNQQTFAFQTHAAARSAAPLTQPVRYCDAPVALPLHRILASALDLSLVMISVGILVMMMHLSPAGELIHFNTLPYFCGLAVFLGFGYKLLWALAETDSPGMRWSHLRLLNFDGCPPSRNQRLSRLAGGCLSFAAAGLGLLWALVDEETLSWHDHISKTFASPYPRG